MLAVGGRVVIAKRATLTGNDNTTALATVAEGVEVEILAWQPGGAHGTRYRVLSPKDRVEGWLGASNLKLPLPKPEARHAQRPPAAAARVATKVMPTKVMPTKLTPPKVIPTKLVGRSPKRTKSRMSAQMKDRLSSAKEI